MKERDHRAARRQHVAVAHADEARFRIQDVGRDENPFLQRFGHAHHVDRFARLVGADRNDRVNGVTVFADRAHDVGGAHAIGQHGFGGKIFARRDLFQRCGVDDDVRSFYRRADRRVIPHVADAKLQDFRKIAVNGFIGRDFLVQISQAHRMLLCFVSREHDDFFRRAVSAAQNAPN